MLRSQHPYLRLHSDEYFDTMDQNHLSAERERIGELDADAKKTTKVQSTENCCLLARYFPHFQRISPTNHVLHTL